jgi:hypothetical protein
MATLGSPWRVALLATLALTFAACATVQHGPVQRIPVDSEPTGAVVYTEDCGPGSTREATTPGVIWVSRRAERCALIFTAPGYELERVVLTREIAEEFLENIDFLDADSFFISGFLAGAGFGVDAITGALFEQQPHDVFVSLVPFEELRLEIDEESEEPEEPPQ